MFACMGRGLSTACSLAVFAVSGWALAADGTHGMAGEPAHAAESHGASGHSSGAHHDPTDLTAANRGAKLEDPSEWRYELAIATLVVFLCLLLLLCKFAWRPIMTGLEQRERSIQDRIDEANRAAEQAAELLRAHQAKLAAAAGDAQQIIAQAQRAAEGVAEEIRAAAADEARRERERSLADIRLAKNAALREVAKRSADMAVSLAGRIVRRELTAGDHATLITQALEQFPSSN